MDPAGTALEGSPSASPARLIKVLVLVDSLAQGGAERQAAEMVRFLAQMPERFDPVLCTLRAENAYAHLLPAGQPRHVIGVPAGSSVMRGLRRVLRAEQPDIVHSLLEPSNFWNRLLSPAVGRPVVISSVRCRIMRLRFALVEKLLSRRCDAIVVNSVGIKRELVRWQRVSPGKLRVIGNFVNFERFKPLPDEVRTRVRRKLELDGPTFLLPGRMGVQKYQIGLALALRRLKRCGELPESARFLLAGGVSQGYLGWLFWLLLRRSGLDQQVRALGKVTAIEELYAAADWIVLPSLWEGLPNAALEAHACARPLLLSHAANLDGIMADGETGYEFPTGSSQGLAAAMVRALGTSAVQARTMGQAGQQRVRQRFDPARIGGELVSLYEEHLARRQSAGRKLA